MSGSLVFITGSTGFVGAEVVAQALEAGYRVRLAVRRAEQEAIVRARYPGRESEIEFVIIPDISERAPFEEALKGVENVIHVASPVPGGKANDLKEEYIKPAVKGTEAILYAALKFPDIKTVVVTSSMVGIMSLETPMIGPYNVKENTRDVLPVDVDAEIADDGWGGHATKYRISKILAHQATRDFLAREKPHFKLLTMHPVFVIGHSRVQTSPETIDIVNGSMYNDLRAEKPSLPSAWVGVKDVAAAHVKAISAQDVPTGTEFNLCGPEYSWDQVAEFVKKNFPGLCNIKSPIGSDGFIENAATEKYLGLKWTPHENNFREALDQQLSFQTGLPN